MYIAMHCIVPMAEASGNAVVISSLDRGKK